ncbi:hypothetical protein GY45DRAFT_1062648 [Cubamyces sp. BRFM 1775]|nr:hypothetical protein GY45DRAFT_1062648 [Cubamyces sp. BRFM 1775]
MHVRTRHTHGYNPIIKRFYVRNSHLCLQADNSQGQSPCQVATELLQPCGNSEGLNDCYCSPVTYSLWAACVLCNGQSPHSFSDYYGDGFCNQQYKSPPLNGVDVPGWANLELINGDTFDVQAAKKEAGASVPDPNLTPTDPSTAPTSIPEGSSVSQMQSSEPNSTLRPSSPSSATLSSSAIAATAQSSVSTPHNEGSSSSQVTAPIDPSSGSAASTYTGQLSITSLTASSETGVLYPPRPHGDASSTNPSASQLPTFHQTQSAIRGSSSLGPIIGGALGGVVLIAILSICVLWRRRRPRRSHTSPFPCQSTEALSNNQDSSLSIGDRRWGKKTPAPFAAIFGTRERRSSRSSQDGYSGKEALKNQSHNSQKTKDSEVEEMEAVLHLRYAEEDSFAPPSYTARLYDPDDPSTYPPPLSEICRYLPGRIPPNRNSAP